jgi:hypothetical protein
MASRTAETDAASYHFAQHLDVAKQVAADHLEKYPGRKALFYLDVAGATTKQTEAGISLDSFGRGCFSGPLARATPSQQQAVEQAMQFVVPNLGAELTAADANADCQLVLIYQVEIDGRKQKGLIHSTGEACARLSQTLN